MGEISDVTKLAGFEFTEYVRYEDEGEIIALRGLNCKNGSLDLNDVKYIDNSVLEKLIRSKLCIGDILFTYVGTVGEVAIIEENDRFYLAPNVSRIRLRDKYNPYFIKHQLYNKRFYNKVVFPLIATSSQPALSMENVRRFKLNIPTISEQDKIAKFLNLLDLRISTQRKIIEDLKKLKDAITHFHFRNELTHSPMTYIGQYITQVSRRNKDTKIDRVLSVSNKYGFVDQDEQFEDRVVASIDTSNYKVVQKGDFAYNPARINVGSVAILQEFENGIVSPMYVCFTTNKGLLPAYFELYLSTNIFKHEMYKRLEGSVRLCLTYESLCNIKIALPEFSVQTDLASKVSALLTKIKNEERLLCLYHNFKQYLLTQMFI